MPVRSSLLYPVQTPICKSFSPVKNGSLRAAAYCYRLDAVSVLEGIAASRISKTIAWVVRFDLKAVPLHPSDMYNASLRESLLIDNSEQEAYRSIGSQAQAEQVLSFPEISISCCRVRTFHSGGRGRRLSNESRQGCTEWQLCPGEQQPSRQKPRFPTWRGVHALGHPS